MSNIPDSPDPLGAVKPLASGSSRDPWTQEKNARRYELIDKDMAVTITKAEQSELDHLQKQAIAYRDHVTPLPLEGARKLHQDLLKKRQHGSQG